MAKMSITKVLMIFAATLVSVHGATTISRNVSFRGCPNNYSRVGSMCVRPYSIDATYAEAYKLCRVVGATLASPSNQEEIAGLGSLFQSLQFRANYFVRKTGFGNDCQYLNNSDAYALTSVKCEKIMYFVCQK